MTTAACCPGCGAELLPDSAFCHACGQAQPAPAVRAPGERKRITVLFIDAFGSIGLGDRLDAEQWRDIMESFFSVVSIGVQHFGGTIDRLTGEGIKVLFGAPVALESHATQACHAALHIAQRLGEFATSFRARAGVDFSVRMGLNSGEVVFGQVGATGFTSQGHTAALAARMQQLAEPGQIYVTEHTAALVKEFFELREMGPLAVRNANRNVQVFELVGAREHHTRLDAARERGLSPFIGREAEMSALEHELERAADDASRVVGIVGEPGIGKSRLGEEFVARQRARGLRVHVTRCVEHARWIPFHALLPYLRAVFGIAGGGDATAARERIRGTLQAIDPQLLDCLPILFTVLGIADQDESARATAASAPTRDLARVMRSLMEASDADRPSLFVVDDHQWMDAGSDAVFGDLVADPPRSAALVLVTYRRGHRRRWMRASNFAEIPLRPLERAATVELVRALIGDDRSLDTLPLRIVDRAGGNPFFVEEIVRALVDCGALVGAPGRYRLARPDADVVVPGSLHAVLAARVDQLGEHEKQVLQAAAVIGREFSLELLGAVTGLAPEVLARVVQALEAGDFVHGSGWGDPTVQAFRHPLLRETVYRSLLADQRRQLHAAVVRALREQHRATPGLEAAQLAHHAEAAGDALEAARSYHRAAQHTSRWDPLQGLEHWRRVLANTTGGTVSVEVGALRLAACEAVVRLGLHQALPVAEAAALLDEGDALAQRLGDRRTTAMLHSARAHLASAAGDLARAHELHATAAAEADAIGDTELRLAFAARLVLTERLAGALPAALQRADRILAETAGETSPDVVLVRHQLELARIAVLLDLGDTTRAADDLTRVVTALRAVGSPPELAWTLALSARLVRQTGTADPLLVGRVEEARTLALNLGVPGLIRYATAALAMVRLAQGQWGEARALALEANEVGIAAEHPLSVALDPDLELSSAAAQLGDDEDARLLAERSLQRSASRGSQVTQIDGLIECARVRLRAGGADDLATARRLLQLGLLLARDARARSRLPFLWLELAAVARQAGDERGARARQRRATRALLAIDAVGYLQRAAALLGPDGRER